MPKTKTTKSTAKKAKSPARKTVRAKKLTTKSIARAAITTQSKSKLSFFLGILIIITGASIMIEILSMSFSASNSDFTKDFFLFPIAMVFLLLGIGIVANRSFYSKI